MDAPAPAPAIDNRTDEPLLPAFLLRPSAVLWLWWLPIGIMLLLNWQGYQLISGDMDAAQNRAAVELGLACAGNLLAGVGAYFVFLRFARHSKQRSWSPAIPVAGAVTVVLQAAYLWFAMVMQDDVLPSSVLAWIYTPGRFAFTQFAFAMVPLFYGVLLLACTWRVQNAGQVFGVSFGAALGAPLALYLVLQLTRFGSHLAEIVVAVGLVLLGIVMFVAIIRALMVGLKAGRRLDEQYERWAILVVAFVFPIGGLLLNRSIPFPVDFQAWEVYALVGANTAILLFASWRQREQPVLSYGLLCVTLPFSLYFFVVFLPYLLLSILAVIVVGVGFLVLTPTILLTLHLNLLNGSLRGALASQPKFRTAAIGLLCFLVLPAYFTVRAVADKVALNAALNHVYAPAVSSTAIKYPSSITNLERALRSHRAYKNGIYYPLLSDYYSWLVFDNLVLPDDKLDALERIFVGARGSDQNTDLVRNRSGWLGGSSVRRMHRHRRAAGIPQTVQVEKTTATVRSVDDTSEVITLTLCLRNNDPSNAEYVEKLPLPPGVLVAGLRLHMHGVPVAGRIFEKKTALWVYEMIRDSERRDPALVVYRGANEVELRVFPVAANETSTVELDLLVPKNAVRMSGVVAASNPRQAIEAIGQNLSAHLIAGERSSEVVGNLPPEIPYVKAERSYLHLIIDRSSAKGFQGDLAQALRELKSRFPEASSVRITAANYGAQDLVRQLTPIDQLIANPPSCGDVPLRGGLFADLALAHAIKLHEELDLEGAPTASLPSRPIFAILSRHAESCDAPLELTRHWAELLERLEIHEFGADGTSATWADEAAQVQWLRLGPAIRPYRRTASFGRSDEASRLEYWAPENGAWLPAPPMGAPTSKGQWENGVLLLAAAAEQARNPGGARLTPKELIGLSRESGVLLPISSYIVVENPAQWQVLINSEKQKLGQNSALEFVETPAPPALWIGGAFTLWLVLRRKRHRKSVRDRASAQVEAVRPNLA